MRRKKNQLFTHDPRLFYSEQITNTLLKNLHRVPTEVQISIIRHLGDKSIKEGIPAMQSALKNGPPALQAVAAKSLYQPKGEESKATQNGTLDGKDHPGIQNDSGHIGFLGHGSEVHFKDIRIRSLE